MWVGESASKVLRDFQKSWERSMTAEAAMEAAEAGSEAGVSASDAEVGLDGSKFAGSGFAGSGLLEPGASVWARRRATVCQLSLRG